MKRGARKHAVVASVVAYSALGFVVVATYAPQQVVIWPSEAVRDAVAAVLPEGWAFFTKDPTGSVSVPVPRGARAPESIDRLEDVMSVPSPGLSRERRNALMQIELIDRALDDRGDIVQSCGRTGTCMPTANAAPLIIVNPVRSPTLCGVFDVYTYSPTPWHWRHLVDGRYQRDGAAAVTVSCADDRLS